MFPLSGAVLAAVRRIAFFSIAAAALAGCSGPHLYADHQPVRGRVTKVWTRQDMSEDWSTHVRGLGNAPSLETYLGEYSKVTVYLGHVSRSRIYEFPLSRSAMNLAEGAVGELDIGIRTRDPLQILQISRG